MELSDMRRYFRMMCLSFAEICGWFYHPVIRVPTNKIDDYGKTRLICDYLNVHVCTNIRYKERVVFLDMICAVVRSTIACIGYFHHYNLNFILLLKIDARGPMKLIQVKKFILL